MNGNNGKKKIFGFALIPLGCMCILIAVTAAKSIHFLMYLLAGVPLLLGWWMMLSAYSQEHTGQAVRTVLKKVGFGAKPTEIDPEEALFYRVRNRFMRLVLFFAVYGYFFIILGGGYQYFNANSMQKVTAGDGTEGSGKVIAYNLDEEKYTAEYVSRDLLARKAEDVSIILYYETEMLTLTETYRDTSWSIYEITFTCEEVRIKLVDRCTGEVLGTETYTASPPDRYEKGSNRTIKLDKQVIAGKVKSWIETDG